ncbi:hypothetical protein P4506_09990, partial [Geobacillus stearothermophilus]|uniref:hypothetical protein n=1 Tax=Geobacillus stearothermophilus TaxID=1422 RepID=UPI0030C8FC07
AFLLPFLAIFSIPSRIRSVYRTHQVVGIFTEKFHEQFLLSTRDENGHSKGAHFHGKVVRDLESKLKT